MKKLKLSIILLFVLFYNISYASTKIDVLFSPNGGIENRILQEIKLAKSEILIQAYMFTNKVLVTEIINAKKRNIKIEIILDKNNTTYRYSVLTTLINDQIIPYIDSKHSIAHDKIIMIDKLKVITGSYNYTKAAENRNGENLLVIEDPSICELYILNFEMHKEHSDLYRK